MKNVVLSLFLSFLLLGTSHTAEGDVDNGYTNGHKRRSASIIFSDQDYLTDEIKRTIVASRPVKRCMLDQTPLTSEDLKLVFSLNTLQSLSVVGCGLARGDAQYLNLQSLRELYISHNQFSLEDLKKHLTLTTNVIILHCWGIPIGDEGINFYLSVMPSIKEINVSACNLGDTSLDYLLMFNNLQKVIMSGNNFSGQALAFFEKKAKQRHIEAVI